MTFTLGLGGLFLLAFTSLGLAHNSTNQTVLPVFNGNISIVTFNSTAQNGTNVTTLSNSPTNMTIQGYYEVTTSTLNAAPLNLTDLSVIKNDTRLVIVVPCEKYFNEIYYTNLTTVYKNAGNYTVIKMNWKNMVNHTESLEEKTRIAGKQLAKLIGDLQKRGVKESNIHLIGSYGGVRVASYAAKLIPTNSSGRIGRFTALNPPGKSLWSKLLSLLKDDDNTDLKPTDADVLDTLHTMNGYSSTGGIDFYANKGRDQPGCGKDESCYLKRGVELYTESIQSKNFVAQKCTYGFFRGWVCIKNSSIIFGENMPNGVYEGTYVFETKTTSPYAKG